MRLELFNIDINFTLPVYINIVLFEIYLEDFEAKEMFGIFYNDGCLIVNLFFKEFVLKRSNY